MRLRLALLVGLAFYAGSALAQAWTAYPAFNDVREVAASATEVWAATPAGVFSYDPETGAFSRYTTVEGLRGGDVGALAVDGDGRVWIGYADGALDRIEPETGDIRTFLDIARADQFTSRGVNRIRPREGQLLVATDFGLVVFDTDREEVRQTASRLGTLEAATPVQDILVAPAPSGGSAYWLATDEGLVWTPSETQNLQVPTAWTVEPGFVGESYALAEFQGEVWASGRPGAQPGDVYRRRSNGTWERRAFGDGVFSTLIPTGEVLFAVAQGNSVTTAIRPGLPNVFYQTFPDALRLQSIVQGPGDVLWAGDSGLGLFSYPDLPPGGDGAIPVSPSPVLPSGPFTNAILSLDVGRDGTLWTASNAVQFGISNTAAVSWLTPDGSWQVLRTDDPTSGLPQQTQRTIVARPEGGAIVGSDGGGLAVVTEAGEVTAFSATNSTLLSAVGQPNYVVVSDIVREGDRWWVANWGSPRPLHVFPGTESATVSDWTALPAPPGAPTAFPIRQLALDPFGQKWLALEDQGLLVWDTGSDPLSSADDRGRRFTSGLNGQGLPNGNVTALALDREGRMWVGTERGIAIVFSPGSAFAGDGALTEPQWARTADGTSYLLRDVLVRDMALDPAGRLWIATTTGAYLLNAEGDAVVTRLGADTTPLPTDDIVTIAVEPRSGIVYLATAAGLYAYQGDARAADPTSESLRLAPNPFRPTQHTDLMISGLSASTSRVRVLTVDGRVVYQSDEVFGGSFRWDGRDVRTGERVPSGVYLIAASGTDSEGTLYGKLAVIH